MISQRAAASRAQVTGEADVNRNLSNRKLFQKFRIARRAETVTNTLGPKIERPPDRIRPGILTGMRGQTQAVVGSPGIGLPEEFRRRLHLIAANPNAHHSAIFVAGRNFKDAHGRLGSELSNRVEDPQK